MKNFDCKRCALRSWHFLAYIVKRFFEDNCTYRATALAYTTLLSLVPLLAVSFTIIAAFPTTKDLVTRIENFIFSHFVAATGATVQAYFQSFVGQVAQISIVGSVVLLLSAILLLSTIEKALNAIWRVRQSRRFGTAVLMYWAMLTLSPLLIALSIALSTYLTTIPLFSGAVAAFGLKHLLLLSYSPIVLVALAFTLLYVVVPNTHVPLWHALVAGLVAAVLFEAAKWGFTFYITHFRTYELLYGALASIPIFLLWIYICWVIILIGAEVTQAISRFYEHRLGNEIGGFIHAYRWIGYLWQAQQKGEGLKRKQLIAKDKEGYQVAPEEILKVLVDAKLIASSGRSRYLLTRDLNTMSLAQLHEVLPWKLPRVVNLTSMLSEWELKLSKQLEQVERAEQLALTTPLATLYEKEA